MAKRYSRTPSAARKPVDASTAAPVLLKFMLKLFDREDGKAADWPLIAETLLAQAFYALDQSPDDPRSAALLRRAHTGAYDRIAGNALNDPSSTAGQGFAADTFNGRALRPEHGDAPKV